MTMRDPDDYYCCKCGKHFLYSKEKDKPRYTLDVSKRIAFGTYDRSIRWIVMCEECFKEIYKFDKLTGKEVKKET